MLPTNMHVVAPETVSARELENALVTILRMAGVKESGEYPCLREDAGILAHMEQLYCTMRSKYKYRFISIAARLRRPQEYGE